MTHWRARLRYLFGIGVLLAAAGVALALFGAWTGIVNISASAGHPPWVESFLELGMRRSIERHSSKLVVPNDLRSPDRIQLGAAHFAGGCAECHGAPDRPRSPIYDYMLPVPPDLAFAAQQWNARELFFIVRHGLQFTGMPEWSGGERDDEVWSMVAFLQRLPELTSDEYVALASGNAGSPDNPRASTLRDEGVATLARTSCDRCHDTARSAPASAFVPRLAGQSQDYLVRSLREYQRGERRSGFMQPVAAMLSEQDIDALAAHYSALRPARPSTREPVLSDQQREEAAAIATGNHASLRVPACLSCHAPAARDDYPLLAGQPANYLVQQLQLFQQGGRQQSAWGEVMSVIATRLDAAQIDMLAQWFSDQAPGVFQE